MNLKRTVYHLAGKDYEANDVIIFEFDVQRVSISNFLNLSFSGHQVRRFVKSISGYFLDSHHTTVDNRMKRITVRAYASMIYNILEALGMDWYHAVETLHLRVRNVNLRKVKSVTHERYNGISVFDPITKKQYYTSNSPKKIVGRQAIINGKLWRRYL
jgi:hypothetical protein